MNGYKQIDYFPNDTILTIGIVEVVNKISSNFIIEVKILQDEMKMFFKFY